MIIWGQINIFLIWQNIPIETNVYVSFVYFRFFFLSEMQKKVYSLVSMHYHVGAGRSLYSFIHLLQSLCGFWIIVIWNPMQEWCWYLIERDEMIVPPLAGLHANWSWFWANTGVQLHACFDVLKLLGPHLIAPLPGLALHETASWNHLGWISPGGAMRWIFPELAFRPGAEMRIRLLSLVSYVFYKIKIKNLIFHIIIANFMYCWHF